MPRREQFQEETMIHVISVEPFGDGWAVRPGHLANEMIFRSGKSAEAAARSLANKLASAGEPAEVQIHLRDGAVVSSTSDRAVLMNTRTPAKTNERSPDARSRAGAERRAG
jgi:hypothetical protein